MLWQGEGKRVPCKEQYQKNNVAKHRGCQPPTGWVGDVNRPFERSQTCLSIGHEWILLLLIVFRLAFFLQIELGLFLLFLIAFIFFSSVTHGFLLYWPLLDFTCSSFRFGAFVSLSNCAL